MQKIAIYIPSNISKSLRYYLEMVWLLVEHGIQSNPSISVIILNNTGKLPRRLQHHDRVTSGKLMHTVPGIAGRYLQQRQLSNWCKNHKASLWAPLGISFKVENALKQVIGLPFLVDSADAKKKLLNPEKFNSTEAVFTVSTESQKQYWQNKGLAKDGQVIVIGECTAYVPQLVSWAMGEAIKTRFANGHEYFLVHGELTPEEEIINILKAFSKFKKRHHTNMALVLMSDGLTPVGLIEKLKSYAFRNSVFVVEHISGEERKQVLATCYAYITVRQPNAYSRRFLEAMVQGTLCLVAKGSMEEELIASNALAYGSIDELFAAMSKCFVDENLKNHFKQILQDKQDEYHPATVWAKLETLLLSDP